MRHVGLAVLFILAVSISATADSVFSFEDLTERLSNKHFSSELNLSSSNFSNLNFNGSHSVGLHVGWAKHNGFSVGTAGAPVVELMSAPEVCVEAAPVLSAPEPASMLLLGTGLLGIGAMVRKAHHRRTKN